MLGVYTKDYVCLFLSVITVWVGISQWRVCINRLCACRCLSAEISVCRDIHLSSESIYLILSVKFVSLPDILAWLSACLCVCVYLRTVCSGIADYGDVAKGNT